jgi:urease accessory protein
MDITTPTSLTSPALLRLLQLTSPTLPVGAYSYSEGLEYWSQVGKLDTPTDLAHWLTHELRYGAIRLEAAVLLRAYHHAHQADIQGLRHWNGWLSALREAEEMRHQSWQMGWSLIRLLMELEPDLGSMLKEVGEPCNFAIAFAVAAAFWQIDLKSALLGYLHSWASNLVNAGVRVIPLGQTAGQMLLLNLYPHIQHTVDEIWVMPDPELKSCSWGVAIASMNHEVLYSRLFRS